MGITGGVGLTAAIVAAFREANPGVVVRYVQADGLPAVQHDVADHRAHTAFAYEPIIREELAFAELTREPVWVGLPAPHPAAKLATVAPNDVHDLACIGPWSTLPRQIVDRWTGPFAAGRGEPPWGPETTALNDSLLGVSEGLGFFFVNEVFAELYPRPGIAYRPALGIEPVAFGVTWRPEADLPLVRSLLEISVKVASRG